MVTAHRRESFGEGFGASGGYGVGYGAPASVGAALGNRDLGRLLPTLQVHLLQIQPPQAAPFGQHVRDVAEAVLADDAGRAERAVRRHFQALAEHLRRMPDEAFAADG